MQIRTFVLPAVSPCMEEEELNRFLRSHRILQIEHHFCNDKGGFWAVLVEYIDSDPQEASAPVHRRDRHDKQDVTRDLSEEERHRFDYFKQVRRQLATKNSIPAYLIFTNEELAILARMEELTAETVKDVKGIAPSRLKAYIEHFYVVKDAQENKGSDAQDSIAGEPA